MPIFPQSLDSSFSSFRSSFNTHLQNLLILSIGKFNYLNIRDLKYIFDRNLSFQQFKSSKQEEVYRKSIQRNISIYLGVGAVSSIFMNMLVQKISPKFSNVTAGKLILDLGIASICIGTALYLSLNAIQSDVGKIKKLYFQQKDVNFIRHLKEQGSVYDVSMQNQIRRFMNKKQFDLWNSSEGVQLLQLIQ